MSILTTPALTPPPQQSPAVPTEPIFRLSVAQYHQMIDAGILTEDNPVELLDGWLVQKMPRHPPHRIATRKTRETLDRFRPAGWYSDSQEAITTDTSEPEPDVMLVRGDSDHYHDRNPGPQDIGLLVEVSDSTLARDRGFKKRIYAESRIAVYWIVNLIDNQVEVYTDPTGPTETPDYRQRRDYGVLDEIPFILDGQEIGRFPVRDLLP
jgi:hypothetical protein